MTPTRTESFVPLATAPLASSGERTEFKATVMSQPGQVQKFHSVAPVTATAAVPATPRAANCEPKVSLQRDGNRVTGIQVQCSCGEVINLSCVYEAAAAVPPAVPATEPIAAPEPATIPQPEATKLETGKKGKDSGKDLPTSASKKPKVPEKGRGTPAAKRRSA